MPYSIQRSRWKDSGKTVMDELASPASLQFITTLVPFESFEQPVTVLVTFTL
jgi:hypothetical protein